MRHVTVFVVVAGGEEDAERRSEIAKRPGHSIGVEPRAVKEIAGDKSDVWTKPGGHARDATAESDAVDVAQVKVADQKSRAAAPGCGQVGELDATRRTRIQRALSRP